MHRHGIRATTQRRFRVVTTDGNHSLSVADNLLDQTFLATRPNQIWLADITYIPTDEGWLYMATVLDLFTRKVVGWAMRDHMRQELTIAALTMAIQRRRPGPGLIHHSHRGSQYAAGRITRCPLYRGKITFHHMDIRSIIAGSVTSEPFAWLPVVGLTAPIKRYPSLARREPHAHGE